MHPDLFPEAIAAEPRLDELGIEPDIASEFGMSEDAVDLPDGLVGRSRHLASIDDVALAAVVRDERDRTCGAGHRLEFAAVLGIVGGTDDVVVDVVAILVDAISDANRLGDVLVAGELADVDEPILALVSRRGIEALGVDGGMNDLGLGVVDVLDDVGHPP